MKIQITTRKPVFDDNLGRLKEGDIVEIADKKANFYIQEGLATCYQTKVMQDRPYQAVGATEQSFASPPALASQQTTAKESEPGEKKKKGRKPKQSS